MSLFFQAHTSELRAGVPQRLSPALNIVLNSPYMVLLETFCVLRPYSAESPGDRRRGSVAFSIPSKEITSSGHRMPIWMCPKNSFVRRGVLFFLHLLSELHNKIEVLVINTPGEAEFLTSFQDFVSIYTSPQVVDLSHYVHVLSVGLPLNQETIKLRGRL